MWFGYIDPGAGTIILQTLIAAAEDKLGGVDVLDEDRIRSVL